LNVLAFVAAGAVVAIPAAFADTTPQTLPFSQNWSNTGLIQADDDWSLVPGIIGYRGDGMTATTGVDPQTVTADGSATPVDVNANERAPDLQEVPPFTPAGVAEFDQGWSIPQAVVAVKGDTTARAPHLVITLDTTGKSGITVNYLLGDIQEAGNAVMPVALHYRVGNSGPYTNVPAGFVADASCTCPSPGLATPVSAALPAAADNQPLVNLRIMTTDAEGGNDEWIAIDEISITSQPPTAVAVRSFAASRTASGALVRWRTGSEVETLGFNIIRAGGGTTVKLNRSLITASTSGLQSVSLRGTKSFLAASRLAG